MARSISSRARPSPGQRAVQQGAPQVAYGDLGRAPAQRHVRGGPQHVHRPRVAGGDARHQLGGDLFVGAPGAVQQLRRAVVQPLPLSDGHRRLDGVRHDAVDESRLPLVGRQPQRVQGAQRRREADRVQAGQPGERVRGRPGRRRTAIAAARSRTGRG